MKKNSVKIAGYIILILIVLGIGIMLGKSIIDISSKKDEKKSNIERVSQSTIAILSAVDDGTSVREEDLKLEDELFNNFKKIINSSTIKSEVEKKYLGVDDINLELETGGVIKAIYYCKKYSDEECVDINNTYISTFIKEIVKYYNVSAHIIDYATVSNTEVNK